MVERPATMYGVETVALTKRQDTAECVNIFTRSDQDGQD